MGRVKGGAAKHPSLVRRLPAGRQGFLYTKQKTAQEAAFCSELLNDVRQVQEPKKHADGDKAKP